MELTEADQLTDQLHQVYQAYGKTLALASFGGILTISVSPPGCPSVP